MNNHKYAVQLKSGLWIAYLDNAIKAQELADQYEGAEVIPL